MTKRSVWGEGKFFFERAKNDVTTGRADAQRYLDGYVPREVQDGVGEIKSFASYPLTHTQGKVKWGADKVWDEVGPGVRKFGEKHAPAATQVAGKVAEPLGHVDPFKAPAYAEEIAGNLERDFSPVDLVDPHGALTEAGQGSALGYDMVNKHLGGAGDYVDAAAGKGTSRKIYEGGEAVHDLNMIAGAIGSASPIGAGIGIWRFIANGGFDKIKSGVGAVWNGAKNAVEKGKEIFEEAVDWIGGLFGGKKVSPPPPDPRTLDTDNDGLDDATERDNGLDPNNADTDGDGFNDKWELHIIRTDPKKADTDGDGVRDADEVRMRKTDPRVYDARFTEERRRTGLLALESTKVHRTLAPHAGAPTRPVSGGRRPIALIVTSVVAATVSVGALTGLIYEKRGAPAAPAGQAAPARPGQQVAGHRAASGGGATSGTSARHSGAGRPVAVDRGADQPHVTRQQGSGTSGSSLVGPERFAQPAGRAPAVSRPHMQSQQQQRSQPQVQPQPQVQHQPQVQPQPQVQHQPRRAGDDAAAKQDGAPGRPAGADATAQKDNPPVIRTGGEPATSRSSGTSGYSTTNQEPATSRSSGTSGYSSTNQEPATSRSSGTSGYSTTNQEPAERKVKKIGKSKTPDNDDTVDYGGCGHCGAGDPGPVVK